MTSASEPVRARNALRAAAVIAAVTAMSTVSGTAHAATRPSFGSPSRSHSTGSFGLSPAGSVYDGAHAVAQLHVLATATRTASATGALINGSSTADGETGRLTIDVDGTRAAKLLYTGPLSYQIYESPTTEYVPLDTSDPDTRAALQLLNAPSVHYAGQASTQPVVNPADLIEQLYASDAPAISGMKRSEHRGVVRYQIAVSVPAAEREDYPSTVTVSTDPTGRLTSFAASTSGSADIEQYTVGYGPHPVTLPNPQDVVDAVQLQRATASLHLSQALAFVALDAYASALPDSETDTETVTQFRAAARTAATDPDNGMGGITVTVADVASGVTLTARNPYTNAVVTVRAVLDGNGWISVTDSSGRPIGPGLKARSTTPHAFALAPSAFRG